MEKNLVNKIKEVLTSTWVGDRWRTDTQEVSEALVDIHRTLPDHQVRSRDVRGKVVSVYVGPLPKDV